MARKLSSKQRKAHKRASYIRSEYYKNFDALDYLRNFGKVKDIKIPNKITKASLKAIRKAYKEAKANLPKTDGFYVDYSTGEILTKLPTKEEKEQIVDGLQGILRDVQEGRIGSFAHTCSAMCGYHEDAPHG